MVDTQVITWTEKSLEGTYTTVKTENLKYPLGHVVAQAMKQRLDGEYNLTYTVKKRVLSPGKPRLWCEGWGIVLGRQTRRKSIICYLLRHATCSWNIYRGLANVKIPIHPRSPATLSLSLAAPPEPGSRRGFLPSSAEVSRSTHYTESLWKGPLDHGLF